MAERTWHLPIWGFALLLASQWACLAAAADKSATEAVSSPAAPLSQEAKEAAAAGIAAFEQGDFEKAALRFRRMLALAPGHPMALVNLATAEFQMGDPKEAEALLEQAIEIEPRAPEVWTTLGIVRLTNGNARGALTALAMATEQRPDNARARNYLGAALAELGWLMGAEAELRKAVELDPEYADAHFNLALVYLRRVPPPVELARRHYQRAIDLGTQPDPLVEKQLEQLSTGESSPRP